MRFWGHLKKLFIWGLICVAIVAAIYFTFVRPWIMRIGATNEEVVMTLPGDGLVTTPGVKYTHAITINAPKEIIWGYVVQMGHKRAGWYNWDAFNRLADKDYFFENGKSADRIIPELQNLEKGGKIAITPQIPAFDVTELEKYRHMLLTARNGDAYTVTWAYSLKEIDKDTTRLYVRWTSDISDSAIARVFDLLLTEPGGAGIQQSLNLRGIKTRAERDFANQTAR